jgi:hypothetical protein
MDDNSQSSPPLYFDDVGAAITSAGVGNLVLIEYQIPLDLAPVRLEPKLVARLRFGLKAAVALRQALDNIIDDLSRDDAGPNPDPADEYHSRQQRVHGRAGV